RLHYRALFSRIRKPPIDSTILEKRITSTLNFGTSEVYNYPCSLSRLSLQRFLINKDRFFSWPRYLCLINHHHKTMKPIISKLVAIDRYRIFFETGIKVNDAFPRIYEIISNLSYASQYLEYLTGKIREEGHSIVYTHLIKTYLITGMGVIESTIWYFLKSNN